MCFLLQDGLVASRLRGRGPVGELAAVQPERRGCGGSSRHALRGAEREEGRVEQLEAFRRLICGRMDLVDVVGRSVARHVRGVPGRAESPLRIPVRSRDLLAGTGG